MPRRPARRPRPRPFDQLRIVDKHDGQWHVRPITGTASTSVYTCPGCHRPIPLATPHVVVWPVEKALLSKDALEERRHWHKPCWDKKP